MPLKDFNSKLGNHFTNLIKEQKALNYSISFLEYILWDFDKFIISNNFNNGILSRELVEAWSIQRLKENRNTRNSRLYPIKLLAKYLLVLGIKAYIPGKQGSVEYSTPYIPTRKELKIFFQTIDLWHHPLSYLNYTELIYPVIFRLYYCLGLRLNEAICLKIDEVDLTNGSLYIRHSKGDKDRIVHVSSDLLELLKIYNTKIKKYCNREIYFFPGCSNMKIDGAKKMCKTSIDAKMRYFWKLSFPKWIGKRPTVHCLRHGFVIHRINDWVEQGYKADDLLPYLSKYLGHSSIEETMYYYHSKDTETGAYLKYINTASPLTKGDNLCL